MASSNKGGRDAHVVPKNSFEGITKRHLERENVVLAQSNVVARKDLPARGVHAESAGDVFQELSAGSQPTRGSVSLFRDYLYILFDLFDTSSISFIFG